MNSNDKRAIVKKLLLTPIDCNKTKYHSIQLDIDKGIICSPQKYVRKSDCDMSDFSIGFYEIIYRDIIPNKDGKLLSDKGYLINKEFAGDTINSFNTLANIILGVKSNKERKTEDTWDDLLKDYKRNYHCLANFWLIPMRHGRQSKKLSNTDSLDLYLEKLSKDFKSFKADEFIKYRADNNQYENYFRVIDTYKNFLDKHCISWYMIKMGVRDFYKNKDRDKDICKSFVGNISKFMDERADVISKKYTDELYEYFKSVGIV